MSIAPYAVAAAMLAVVMHAEPAWADDRPQSVAALGECRKITDNSARLACYDKATELLEASITAKDVVVIERAELRQKRKRGFGLAFTEGTILGNAAEPEAKELVAKVTGIAMVGRFIQYTLDSGAVWQTSEAILNQPQLNSAVTIKRGALGSFRMVFAKVPSVTAKRIR